MSAHIPPQDEVAEPTSPTIDDTLAQELTRAIDTSGKRAGEVRVEDADSFGRTYAINDKMIVRGIGARRRQLRARSWALTPESEVVHSLSGKYANLATATKDQFLAYFRNTWDLNATLFSALRDDSVFFSVPDALRRPLIFYFAHPACVYVNKLVLAGLGRRVNPLYEKVFETGVDEMSWDSMDVLQDEDFAWPSVKDSIVFRDQVKVMVEELIQSLPAPSEKPITMDDPRWAIVMGYEHERIHIETSAVLIHQLPIDSVVRPKTWVYAPSRASKPEQAPRNSLVECAAGRVVLGKPRDFPSFGWDNEYGHKEVDVPAFKASKFKVSNAEFLPFVLAGGYRERRWWVSTAGDDEGWRWRCYRNATHPSFWVATKDMPEYFGGSPERPYQKDDGHEKAGSGREFKYRAMFDIISMPWDWPVEVNYLEAIAFCRWKGAQDGLAYRVVTEAEHHRMRGEGTADGEAPSTAQPGAAADLIMREEVPGNTNMRYGSSTPVDFYPPSAAGFHDVHGNVWEWAEDHFAPLPGFKLHYLYDDFSSPCFDGWHTMILGGSWVSTGDQSSRFARYSFRRHFFQHLGFRYVVASEGEAWPGAPTAANIWQQQGEVSELCANHFPHTIPSASMPMPASMRVADAADYPSALAHLVETSARSAGVNPQLSSVLHLESGLGGTSFALARSFARVMAVSSSEDTVRNARVLQHHGELAYQCSHEGVLVKGALAKVPASASERARVLFLGAAMQDAWKQSDVRAAAPYGVVLLDRALTKMTQPLDIVTRLHELVRPGGVLVVASDNDWDPATTPRTSWLGGFKMNGEEMNTLDVLNVHLARSFDLLEVKDLPRLWRHHARKYELELLQVSIWKRQRPCTPVVLPSPPTATPAPAAQQAVHVPEPPPTAALVDDTPMSPSAASSDEEQ